MEFYVQLRRRRVWAVVLVAALAGCFGLHQGTGETVLPEAGATSPGGGKVTQHLYVGDDNNHGLLRVYELPLTASSVPERRKKLNAPFLLGVNGDYVAVVTLDRVMKIFKNPVTSKPAIASIEVTSNGAPLLRPNGQLYQAAGETIEIYSPPFTNNSKPSGSIGFTGIQADQMAQTPSGAVYIDGDSNTIGVVKNHKLRKIVTASSGVQYRGLAATAKNLFACGFTNTPKAYFVDVYALPLTSNSQPKFRVSKGLKIPEACAVDEKGNLYVGRPDGAIDVYTTPISSSSKPAVVVESGADIYGLAIGP